jgi:hypothetical protein
LLRRFIQAQTLLNQSTYLSPLFDGTDHCVVILAYTSGQTQRESSKIPQATGTGVQGAQTKPVILNCPGIERKPALEAFCLLCGDKKHGNPLENGFRHLER